MTYTYDSLTNRCHKVKCCGKPQVLLKTYLSLKECHRNAKRIRSIRSVEYFANAPKLVAIDELGRSFEQIVRKDYNITENSKAKYDPNLPEKSRSKIESNAFILPKKLNS
jgi:hypothetical protein